MRLAGRGTLVTGGSSGIGLALAQALRRAGCEVLVCGRDADKLGRAAGMVPGLRTVVGDLAQPADVRRIADVATDLPGGLSILVNNAAMQRERNLFIDTADDALAATADEVGTNLTGLILLTTLCLPALRAAPAAAVVNLTSGLALAPKAGAPVYCATKAGVHSFTTTLRYQARTHAPGLLVSEVMPPVVDTPMTAGRTVGKVAPQRVAAAIIRGLVRDHTEITIGKVRLLRVVHRIAPSVAHRMMRDS